MSKVNDARLQLGLFALGLASISFTASAQVQLPRIFGDSMVLQRDAPIHVWGWASPGEAVTVKLDAATAKYTADALGRWTVQLPAHAAGGPFDLTVTGKTTVAVHDILIGDVWLASGQSNMEMPLKGFPTAPIKNSAEEIAKADYPEIRLIKIRKAHTLYPLDDLADAASWKRCSPQTAGDISAAGYFFVREIYQHEHVPIGLIDSTWGGTPAEAWVSLGGLAHMASLPAVVAERAADMNAEAGILRQRELDKLAVAAGKPVPKRPGDQVDSWELGTLYNGMISPLLGARIRGVIWLQGESNGNQDRAPAYFDVFSTLIKDWRTQWGIGDFPFLFVQISGFQNGLRDGWPVVRDAQRRTLALPNTGMAVSFDVGEEKQIHFADKQTVGLRLSLLARKLSYGETLVADGPLFRSATPEGKTLRVAFDSGDGLTAKPSGAIGGFEIAGADGKFSVATAKVDGSSVVLSSSAVAAPVYVRYAWRGWPVGANLYNAAGLPTSTFTTQPLPKATF
jgi:sialate O-acetylesterase